MWYFHSFKHELWTKFNYNGQMCHLQKFVKNSRKDIILPRWLHVTIQILQIIKTSQIYEAPETRCIDGF